MQTGRYYLITKQFFESVILSVKNYFVKGKAAQAIRKGLIFMTPLVILSSIALVGINFPISGYQEWLHGEETRWYLSILTLIHSATVDYFSVIVSFAVAWCYAEQLAIKNGKSFVAFGATASFLILINVSYADFNPSYLSTAGISSALLAALVTTRFEMNHLLSGAFYIVTLHLLWFLEFMVPMCILKSMKYISKNFSIKIYNLWRWGCSQQRL